MKKLVIIPIIGLFVAIMGGSIYFYRRTMIRQNAKTTRTMKMSGVNWEQYFSAIKPKREWTMSNPHEDVYIESEDGLKLHATYFKQLDEYADENGKEKAVICFHGYTSEGFADYGSLAGFYLKQGFHVLLVDERAHGKSEGTYIGFGCKDRFDALKWIHWMIEKVGAQVEIILHGDSMGGATVLMTGGLNIPKQVKGIVSDCAFTSPKYVFTHVLNSMYHLPAFPLIQIADLMNRKFAGYGLDECNAAREVKKITVPVLFIHGEKDTFVPCTMCEELYANCEAPKKKIIVQGAGHCESYYKNTQAFEDALGEFLRGVL